MAKERKHRRGRRKKNWFMKLSKGKKIAVCVGGAILLLLLIVGIFVAAKLAKLNTDDITEDIVVNEDAVPEEGFTNVALFGIDSRTGELEVGTRTDCLIVASLNNATKEIKMVSVYRDTVLDIKDNYLQKCNAAYAFGGPTQAINMLNKNLDLNIQEYATVDFAAISNAIDMLGGLEIEVKPEEVTEESNQESGVIMPLPATVDVNNLSDCMVAVSFEKEDIVADEAVQLKVKVWTYDLYDMVDISMLEEGSVIQIRGEDVQVESVEVTDLGVVINGGLDNGGYELRTDENSVYYEIGYSDVLSYYEVGEATLPVAEDFVFIDSSDLDKGEVSYTMDDLQNNEEIYFDFNANNTKVVIEEGEIIVMERVYTP